MNLVHEFAPIVGLLFFFIVFLWIAFRTYRPKVKHELEQHAYIPLERNRHE